MSQEASGLTEDRKKVLRRAFSMAAGTLTSRILGLLRDVALAALFDRLITDAWAAAFRLPNLFRRLLGEGSLAVSFIPVFMKAQGEDPSGVRARNLANSLYTLLLVFLGTLTILGLIYTEELLKLTLAAEYIHLTEKWELTVRMGRIMFGFVFFVCSYAYMTAILNALGSYALAAMAPGLFNLSMLLFTFMPGEWFPENGDGLAWGVFVGGVLQSIAVWMGLQARGYIPKLQLKIWNSDLALVMKNMIPGLIGMGLLQFTTMISLYFASSLAEGAISYIYWADRLLELPLSLISVSIGAALLPTLSSLMAQGLRDKARETLQESFLASLFLALPAALGLYFLAEPIIEVLFKRGQFGSEEVVTTAAILKVYAVGLVFTSCSRVMMPMFYSFNNTWFPALASFLSLTLHVLLAPILMKSYGLIGLVSSGTLTGAVGFLILLGGMSWWKVSFEWAGLVRTLAKFIIAGTTMSVVLVFYQSLNIQMERGLNIPVLFILIGFASIIYIFTASLLGCHEALRIRRLFRL